LAQGKAMRLLRKSGASDKAGRAIALAAIAVAGLAACSSTPKAVNPVELYRSAAGFSLNDDTSGERNAQNLAAGSNEPYPNIGTVPPPPDRAMSSIDRQKLRQGLTEDRTQAKQTDADLHGSGTARAAPTPITRSSPETGDAATAETKHKGDPSSPVGRARATTAHRAPAGSEPAPQESALRSPEMHVMPEGDTPRPAPPPPYLPPPEKARKPAADQAGKPAPGASTAKRPAPAPQTAAAASQPPASTPAIPPVAPMASVPPPPPSDMTLPPPKTVAAATPVPPATVDALSALPPAAVAPAPAPLGASDPQKSAEQQMAALDPARSPPPALVPAPAQTPSQQAALSPAPQAAPRVPAPEPAPTPQRTGRGGTVSLQAAEINFANNGMTLTAEDDRRLAGVVKLYDKHGGIVRVVGYGRRGFGADAAQQELASFSKAIERANVVAKALAQLGLASNRIIVQAAPIGDGLGEDRAEVLLEF
jgi:outer membrane protein OmpA-like peptidoglycan-associated protein